MSLERDSESLPAPPEAQISEGATEESSPEASTEVLAEAPYPPEVQRVELDGREIILVGTAHVSRQSVELVRLVIEREEPDCVCVELDPQRYEALSQQRKWESLDLKQIIRKKQLATLLVNLLLSSYQKRLGMQLGVEPGTELLEATRAAEAAGIPVELCDRDVRITLRRAARSTSFFKKMYLIAGLMATLFEKPEISEEQMQELKQQDVLNEMMNELGRELPSLKKVLIDERDTYLATKIREADGKKLVAVVGAGHMQGILETLNTGKNADLAELEVIPPVSSAWKLVGWGIPLAIVGAITYIGWTQGAEAAGENALSWFLNNSIPTAVGAALSLAHPLTVVAGFLSAPFTSLTPVIGAGYVCAFVQAYFRPPVVKELKTVGDDIGTIRSWWQNKLLRILLVFILTTFGSLIGTYKGGFEIFRNIF